MLGIKYAHTLIFTFLVYTLFNVLSTLFTKIIKNMCNFFYLMSNKLIKFKFLQKITKSYTNLLTNNFKIDKIIVTK